MEHFGWSCNSWLPRGILPLTSNKFGIHTRIGSSILPWITGIHLGISDNVSLSEEFQIDLKLSKLLLIDICVILQRIPGIDDTRVGAAMRTNNWGPTERAVFLSPSVFTSKAEAVSGTYFRCNCEGDSKSTL